MKRTKLCDRSLPAYSPGEEIMNMVTHIVGGAFALVALALCLWKALSQEPLAITATAIYGGSMIILYTMSSVYHGLHSCTAKKVLQVLDHCCIYGLIAGTYTPIVLCAIAPKYPWIGWGLFAVQWLLAIVAIILTGYDLRKYRVFSMICYICAGWSIIFFLPQAIDVLTPAGFWLLLAGGVTYTIGAVLFGLGKKIKWIHSVFHIFVVLGSILQFFTIFLYVL